MGSSSSRESAPPPPSQQQQVALERTLTTGAVNVMTAQLRRIRGERENLKDELREAMEDLELAQKVMVQREKELIIYGAASAVAAAAVGGMVAAMVVGRQQGSALARLSQDFLDLRRRSAAEIAKTERYATSGLVKSLIPALDAMDAAVAHAAAADAEGTQLTRAALLDALRSNGVEQLAPAVGDDFDVSSMEAMFTVPVAEGAPAGKVESVLRPGYSLHGERLLRAAQVGVGAKE